MNTGEDDGQERRVARWRALAEVGRAALPAVSLLVVAWTGSGGPQGRFRAALAGMVVIVALGAFSSTGSGVRGLRRVLTRVVAAAGLAALAYRLGFARADGSGAFGLLVLYLGVGAGASGLAALGRTMRSPALVAGVVAAGVLWTAMAGLFWADPVAERVERTRRRSFRQAVLHVDPALALAYGAVGYDRMRSEEVYSEVELASSYYERPGAATTGSLWLVAGLAAWGAALAAPPRGRRRETDAAPSP